MKALEMELVRSLCKVGKGAETCRYLVANSAGFQCGKLSSLKSTIDKRVEEGSFTSQGDNCEGRP